LTISIGCACGTFVLAGYLFRHRRVKVFKVASPIFLMITLIGCAIMYLEVSSTWVIWGDTLNPLQRLKAKNTQRPFENNVDNATKGPNVVGEGSFIINPHVSPFWFLSHSHFWM